MEVEKRRRVKRSEEQILYMGDVEIVIKVPEGVPKEVVERIISKEVDRIEKLRSVKGILPAEKIDEVIEEIEGGTVL
ncbi:MAG: hypothetical protein GXN93_01535 [Candidatus Diapherotrites archaeon]|nr:hypothetical protein [Candidatus Diapherotrites archaeon]